MRLLLDVTCGGPVAYLRICGHDAAYAGDEGLEDDDDLLAAARVADRTVITRDVALASRAPTAILLESCDVEAQLVELRDAGVDLSPAEVPTRCGRCNGPLEPVPPEASTPEYAPDASESDVWTCRDCGQHFWRGSHWDRVRRTLSRVADADSHP